MSFRLIMIKRQIRINQRFKMRETEERSGGGESKRKNRIEALPP